MRPDLFPFSSPSPQKVGARVGRVLEGGRVAPRPFPLFLSLSPEGRSKGRVRGTLKIGSSLPFPPSFDLHLLKSEDQD